MIIIIKNPLNVWFFTRLSIFIILALIVNLGKLKKKMFWVNITGLYLDREKHTKAIKLFTHFIDKLAIKFYSGIFLLYKKHYLRFRYIPK